MRLMTRVENAFNDFRVQWTARPRVQRVLVWAPVILAAVVATVYWLAPGVYFFVVRDYSLVENLQVVCYLLATIACWLLSRRFRLERRRFLAALFVIGAVGLFFVAGEEVSWGQELWQRIVPGFPGADELGRVNAQGETTLHNLYAVGRLSNFAFFFIAVYGMTSLALDRIGGPLEQRVGNRSIFWVSREAVPSFTMAAAFFSVWFVADLMVGFGEPYAESERAFLRFQEVAELGIAFGILMHVWLLATERTHAKADRPRPREVME